MTLKALPFVLRSLWLACICLGFAGCGGGSSALSKSDLMKYAISRGDDETDEDEEGEAPAASVAADNSSHPPAENLPDQIATEPVQPATDSRLSSEAAADTTGDTALAQQAAGTQAAGTQAAGTQAAGTQAADTQAADTQATNTRPANTTEPGSPETAIHADSNAPLATATEGSQRIGGILPIVERQPTTPLSQTERRRRAAENLEAVTEALVEWIDSSTVVRPSVIRDSQNRMTLSWRVQLLPLLGYEDLYRQFNLQEPWDSPTNKALLEYIPDEFVSPERFNPYTNYQLMVNGPALFSEKETKLKSEISDAPSIVIVAEVDDKFAVPWTAPYDYDITEKPLDRGLGNLREDGIFVGWMTGQVAVWPKPFNQDQLFRAITFEAGDGMPFGPFMNYPRADLKSGGRPSLGAADHDSQQLSQNAASGPTQSRSISDERSTPSHGSNSTITRVNLPGEQEIQAAEDKVRATYESEFKKARTPSDLAQLARSMQKQLSSGSVPSADLYVGLRSAMNVAIKARDPKLAIQLLEELDQRFQIDRDELEESLLDGFLGKTGTLRTELTKAGPLFPIYEKRIDALIEVDDFRAAEARLQQGRAMAKTIKDVATQYRWKILSARVEEGKKLYPRIKKHIATLSNNADDAMANRTVGWYLCIIKDNWREGLKLLTKADHPELQTLAQLEIQNDSDLDRHMALGDGWWKYASENKAEPLILEASLRRARKWYRSAALGLNDGLDRIRANIRLDEIDKIIGQEPVLEDHRSFNQ